MRQDDKTFKDLTTQATENGWIEFKKEAKLNSNNFFKDYATSLGLGQHYDFKPLKEETDNKQIRHQRFQLYYKNIMVEGVEFTLHSQNDVLELGHGKIPEGLEQDVTKPMPESKALEFALAHMKVTLDDLKKPDRKKPEGTLLLARLSDEVVKSSFKLCYTFDIYGNETLNAFKIYVDASTGEVVKKISLIHSYFSPMSTTTKPTHSSVESLKETLTPTHTAALLEASTFIPNYTRYLNGQSSLTFETERVDPNNSAQFRLSAYNNALNTRMATNNNANWASLPDVVNNNGSDWTGNAASRNAQTAHWLTQRMHQYLWGQVNRNGLNGQGMYPRVVTDRGFFGSDWNVIDQITFGRTNGTLMSEVTADMVGHEYMHAVTQFTANLTYQGESGALNEGISDIFGTALERQILFPNGYNWLFGEDLGPNRHFRDMANPGAIPNEWALGRFTQPDRHNGNNWADPNNLDFDHGGVHINSGVLNKWFQTICTGESINPQIAIQSINFDRAIAIVYKTLTTYLQSGSNYSDMAFATIQATRNLYGTCSLEEETIRRAWAAANVPVQNWWYDCPKCNFTLSSATSSNSNPAPNSPITFSVNCSGGLYDCGGIDYVWYMSGNSNSIGTGNSITVNAPSANGSYTYDVYATKTGCNFSSHDVTVNVTNTTTCANVGSISYQRWNNINGTAIQDLRNNTNNLQNTPSHTQTLTLFEAPTDIADNYGVRIRGYVCPPTTGNYTFWVAGDDQTELWISPNDQPSNLTRIAYNNSWTSSRSWTSFSTQQSAPITLQAGQRYYIEALMKEAGGGDNLAVGWQLPGGALERPIPSNRLIPFDGGGSTPPSGCGSGTGLSATYYSGTNLQGSPIATYTQGPIDYAGTQGQTLSGTTVAGNNISARWEGQVEAPASGTFNFNMRTDDGVRVWFNNTQVVNDFGDYPPRDHNFSVSLTAGQKYNLKIEWKQGGGGYEAKLFWNYPNQGTQIVPLCRLFPASGGGCTPPSAPSLSANPSSINSGQSSTLSASNCSGTVNWSTGATGNSLTVSPTSTTTYTATCSAGGCSSGSASVTVTVNGGGGGSNCSAESIECSGNQYEVRNYTVSASGAGTYTIKAHYRSHEGPGVIRWSVNGGSVQTVNVSQTGINDYLEITLGTASLNSGNNVVNLSSGSAYICFKKACIQSGARVGAVNEVNSEPLIVEDENTIQLYPNPSDGKITLRYELEKGKKARLQFTNLTGSVITQKTLVGEGGWQQDQTDLSHQPNGVYLLRFEADKRTITRKFTIVK